VPPTWNQPERPWYLTLSYTAAPVLGLASAATSAVPRLPAQAVRKLCQAGAVA
jgi:hypothetical protein